MYFKKNFVPSDFLKAVRSCSGNVMFRTQEGDVLNLKSQLCMYLFATVSANPSIIASSVVTCENEEDYARLANFLQAQRQEDSHVSV